MPAQLTYSRLTDPRIHGSLNDLNDNEVLSGAAEGVVAFGIAVSRGTDPEKQVILGGAGTFYGIAIRSLSQEGDLGTALIDYADEDLVSVLRDGRINLACPTGCVPGDVANYVDATGVIDSGAAGAGETDIVGATWETTTAAGEVGILRLSGQI